MNFVDADNYNSVPSITGWIYSPDRVSDDDGRLLVSCPQRRALVRVRILGRPAGRTRSRLGIDDRATIRFRNGSPAGFAAATIIRCTSRRSSLSTGSRSPSHDTNLPARTPDPALVWRGLRPAPPRRLRTHVRRSGRSYTDRRGARHRSPPPPVCSHHAVIPRSCSRASDAVPIPEVPDSGLEWPSGVGDALAFYV
nr:hypothetical protein JVH1_3355 [Rhodococcus sp. JVH1]